ncbi:hypothetical protein WK91_18575 [Burkholderia cepacia]|uniref:hypothetical protein n=1 Tax=Burkholderia cepacia TaxID=292 RepID=UPI0007589F30|nr:hypothetical protein [Burkholderia cepacia]KVW15441.1 hypothetical protein WK91_18575 [Burkholderia cepacia]
MIDQDKMRALAKELRREYVFRLSITATEYRDKVSRTSAEAADAIDLLLAEVEAAKLDALKLQRSGQMAATCTHNNVVAMQAAWIEWQYGEGAEGAMEWIENTLAGPGLIPEPDEPHYREAQAYFDANRSLKLSDEALDTQIAELSQQTGGSR